MSYFDDSQIVYVDSKNRSAGTHGQFTIKLEIDQSRYFDRVVVLDCSIPKSYYMIDVGHNYFTLVEDLLNVAIVIPAGNYTRVSLKTTLQSILNTNSPHGYTYGILFDNISQSVDTGKLTFTVSGNGSIQPQFIFANGLYEQLGFESNTTNDFMFNTLVSSNVINLNPESTIFIHSNICQNSVNNILQNIITPLNSSFSYIVFENKSVAEYSKIFNNSNSNVFDFSFTNESGEILDFNGLNVVFTILVYKRNRASEILTDFIKMKTLKSLN